MIMISLLYYILFIIFLSLIYHRIYKEHKFDDIHNVLRFLFIWVYFPFYIILSVIVFFIFGQKVLFAILSLSVICSILIYTYKFNQHPVFMFVPLIFVKREELLLLSLFFPMTTNRNVYFYIPISILFYILLILSSFQAFAFLFKKLLPYFLIVLIKFVLDFKKEALQYIPIIFTAGISYVFLHIPDIYALLLVVLSIIIHLKLKWDERIPTTFAIFYLILAAIALAKGYEDFANELAIVTYWNLVIGVVVAFINTLKEND